MALFTLLGFKPSLEARTRDKKIDLEMQARKLQQSLTAVEADITELTALLRTTPDPRTVKTALIRKQREQRNLQADLEARRNELGMLTNAAEPSNRREVTELIALNNERNARRGNPSQIAAIMERSQAAEGLVLDSAEMFDDFLVDRRQELSPDERAEIDDYVSDRAELALPAIPSSAPAVAPSTVSVDELQQRLDALRMF